MVKNDGFQLVTILAPLFFHRCFPSTVISFKSLNVLSRPALVSITYIMLWKGRSKERFVELISAIQQATLRKHQERKQKQECKQQQGRQHSMDAIKSGDACKNCNAGNSMEGG